jgi:hypothetical protein
MNPRIITGLHRETKRNVQIYEDVIRKSKYALGIGASNKLGIYFNNEYRLTVQEEGAGHFTILSICLNPFITSQNVIM